MYVQTSYASTVQYHIKTYRHPRDSKSIGHSSRECGVLVQKYIREAIAKTLKTVTAEDSRRPHMSVSAVRLPTLGGSVPLSCVSYNHLRMHAVIIIIIIIIIAVAAQ